LREVLSENAVDLEEELEALSLEKNENHERKIDPEKKELAASSTKEEVDEFLDFLENDEKSESFELEESPEESEEDDEFDLDEIIGLL